MATFSVIFSKISQIYNITLFFQKYLNFLCQKIINNLSGKNKNHWYLLLAYKGTYLETKSNEPGYFPILQQMRLPGRPSHGPFYWFISHEFSGVWAYLICFLVTGRGFGYLICSHSSRGWPSSEEDSLVVKTWVLPSFFTPTFVGCFVLLMIGRLIPGDKLEKQDGENWDPHSWPYLLPSN